MNGQGNMQEQPFLWALKYGVIKLEDVPGSVIEKVEVLPENEVIFHLNIKGEKYLWVLTFNWDIPGGC